MESPRCPAHPEAETRPKIRGARDQFWGYEGRFDYKACAECGTWVLDPRPAPSEIGRFYGRYYTPEHLARMRDKFARRGPRRANVVGRLRAFGCLRRLAKLGAEVRAGTRVLDVGAGLAGFLRGMRDLTGAEVRGVDFEPACASFAREVHGIEIDSGELAGQAYEDGRFDLVTAWHALEHVYDPAAELREMARVTRPGGWLVLEVPTSGPVGAAFGRRWLYLQPPTHLYCFKPAALRHLVEAAGYEVLALRRPWFPGELAGSVMLSLGVNRFLEKTFGPDRPLGHKALSAVFYAQMIYDLPIGVLLALAFQSGLLRVFARKR